VNVTISDIRKLKAWLRRGPKMTKRERVEYLRQLLQPKIEARNHGQQTGL
jgi:hypothetical protein